MKIQSVDPVPTPDHMMFCFKLLLWNSPEIMCRHRATVVIQIEREEGKDCETAALENM